MKMDHKHYTFEPSQEELHAVFEMKYGKKDTLGWGPAMRLRHQYYNPDDWYESLLSKLVTEKTRWLEIGCGRHFFPSNPELAKMLSNKCAALVGLDPDSTIFENPYVHEKIQGFIQDYQPAQKFDLVTLRMVAEHITDPETTLRAMAELTQPGSLIVIYTIFKWSPIPLVTYSTPFFLHHPLKRFFWNTESKDTFPVAYKMNTRSDLKSMFERNSFREVYFSYLDDCRTLAKFKVTLWAELVSRKVFRLLNCPYPELCLLGVYERK